MPDERSETPRRPKGVDGEAYVHERDLARTKWATTRLVRDRATGAKLVIKSLPLEGIDDPKVVELFVREAEVLASLDHPKIPRFVDSFAEETDGGDVLHIVQEYIEGETLAEAVARGRRFTEEEAVAFAEGILEILAFLHSRTPPLIHRDIKPSNVVLTADGPALIDFGGVRNRLAQERGVDDEGFTIVGSYGYMPYEQFEGHAVPASDLYSLGVTLVYALAHKEPADIDRDGMKLVFEGSVNVSPDMERVLAKLTQPEWKKRYLSASAVTRALGDVRHPWRRKVRRGFAATVAGLLAASMIWLGATWLFSSRQVEQTAPAQISTPAPDIEPAAVLPVPTTRLVAEGTITFDGKPIGDVTPVAPLVGVIDRNHNTPTATSTRYENGMLRVYGLPPGKYSLSIHIDANENNPSNFPGDYYTFKELVVVEGEVAALEIPVFKIIHLTSPWDNGTRSSDPLNCERQAQSSPVRFAWDVVTPGAEYQYQIDRVRCDPWERLETVERGTTSGLELVRRLDANGDGEIYVFMVTAVRDGNQIGYLTVNGISWNGWDYRFRVPLGGSPP